MPTLISGSTGVDKVQDDSVDIADLSATGTASSSTFLRGDNAWASAGENMTPAFQARQSADQNSLSDSAVTKVSFNVQDFSTGGTYDTTNYRWTPGVAGKYYIGFRVRMNAGDSVANQMFGWIYLNGSVVEQSQAYIENANNYGSAMTTLASKIFTLDADDYVECFAKYNTSDSSAWSIPADTGVFFGYRISNAG